MTRSVALLRGINVGPTTKVPMALLKELFAAAGATDVQTVLNSGNVMFNGTPDAAALAARILESSGVSTSVLILSAGRLRRIEQEFPDELSAATSGNESLLTVAFMHSVPSGIPIPDGLEPELIVFGERAVYQALPNGVSKTKLKPAFWKQFPPETTARNLRTVRKLVALLD